MPPKKAAASSTKSGATHPSYKEMIRNAIIDLKERNGSSRQALKKYVQNNNPGLHVTSQSAFDNQFNRALKAGVEKEEFVQPRGPSGLVKLAKKEKPAAKAAKPAVKKTAAAAPKKATTTTTTTKKAPVKKAAAKTEKAEKPKKAAAEKPKKAAPKTKANITKQRKAPASAPAVVDVPKVIGKTKSGRVTKSAVHPPTTTATKKRAPPKKRTSTAAK